MKLSDRLENEREFHNARFSSEVSLDRKSQVKYYFAIENGYQSFLAELDKYSINSDVLEIGSAKGENLLMLAEKVKSAVGIDISDVGVSRSNDLARSLGHDKKIRFEFMDAENLSFSDESFDLIFGTGVLHHLDMESALSEIRRCLRPGGYALFWEPMGHNYFINLYRNISPESRTPDEHPLLLSDFQLARKYFCSVEWYPFGLSSIACVFFKGDFLKKKFRTIFNKLDALLFRIPYFRRNAWFAILKLH